MTITKIHQVDHGYQLSHANNHFRLFIVSRSGRTEYRLPMMKASDTGRNVSVFIIVAE